MDTLTWGPLAMAAVVMGEAPEKAKATFPTLPNSTASDSRALRTGPTSGGRDEAKMASSRVSPASTGST